LGVRFLQLTQCFLALLTGCGTGLDLDDPPELPGPPVVTVRGVVLDTAGQPLPGVHIQTLFSGATPRVFGAITGTNAQGTFVSDHEITDSTVVPTIDIKATTTDCVGMRDTVISLPFDSAPRLTHDTVDVRIALEGTGPVRLEVGESCAWAARRIVFREFWLRLQIDSLADSVRGRWETAFTATAVNRSGPFAGFKQGDTLFLTLQDTKCSSGYPLRLQLLSGDIIGPGRLESTQAESTCWPYFGFDLQLVKKDIQTYRP